MVPQISWYTYPSTVNRHDHFEVCQKNWSSKMVTCSTEQRCARILGLRDTSYWKGSGWLTSKSNITRSYRYMYRVDYYTEIDGIVWPTGTKYLNFESQEVFKKFQIIISAVVSSVHRCAMPRMVNNGTIDLSLATCNILPRLCWLMTGVTASLL